VEHVRIRRYFPYRSAWVGDRYLTLPKIPLRGLQQAMADAIGERVNNHVMYEVRGENGPVFIGFTDDKVHIGASMVPGDEDERVEPVVFDPPVYVRFEV